VNSAAKSLCNNLTYARHSDWFLPDILQLADIYSQKAVFSNVQSIPQYDGYWSSTQAGQHNNCAFIVLMSNGTGQAPLTFIPFRVWSCRNIE